MPGRGDISFSELRQQLPSVLPDFLMSQRWFGAKSRTIRSAEVIEIIPLPVEHQAAGIFLIRVRYTEGKADIYSLPLTVSDHEVVSQENVEKKIPHLRLPGQIILSDAMWDRDFTSSLLEHIAANSTVQGDAGELRTLETPALRRAWDPSTGMLEPQLMGAEQSNTSIVFGRRLVLKFFRRLEEGINPDLEIGMFLTLKTGFKHIAAVAGSLEYRRAAMKPMSMAILQEFVPNRGDAWKYTLKVLDDFVVAVEKSSTSLPESAFPNQTLLELSSSNPPPEIVKAIGDFMGAARLLGQRTAEMHVALASGTDDPSFAPEPLASSDVRAMRDAMRELATRVFRQLRARLSYLAPELQAKSRTVLAREKEMFEIFDSLRNRQISASRTRIHGDFHLGQVLDTGEGFVIIDFEGEPARSLEERRAKRSPLQDVAGMLRSFHYAAHTALSKRTSGNNFDPKLRKNLESWVCAWQLWVSAAFLNSYLKIAEGSRFLPSAQEERELLLKAFLLEKAVYELGYELNNRPEWVQLPLNGILDLLPTPG
jgi:maltose alpha-D-glucosyltransferase / alpha-amylase